MRPLLKIFVITSICLLETTAFSQSTRVLPPVISNNTQQQPVLSQQNNQLGDLYVQNTQMQTEIRFLTGRIEELQYRIESLKREQSNKIEDIEFRIEELEKLSLVTPQGGNAVVSTLTDDERAQPDAVTESDTTPVGTIGQIASGTSHTATPITEYESALSLLRAGQYKQAESAFQGYLGKYPNSNRTAAAYYWLGETYYVQSQYQNAAKRFLMGFEKFPENSKAPDNLLKLGMSLARIGQAREACLTFAQLKSRYASAPEHIANRADIESNRAGCQA